MSNKKVLAVASSGGHWIQLLRIRPAFAGCTVVFVSTEQGNAVEVEGSEFHHIINANRKLLLKFFKMFFQLLRIFRKVKPDFVITTGAAPGLMALAIGKLFGTKNIWIDSIANVEKLSTSGEKASRFADLYLTQWEELANSGRPQFKGSVL